MKMEIDMISEEHIKPSSPTPPNLRIHKLCLLDQIAAPLSVPIMIYFSAPAAAANNSNIYEHMSTDDFISKTTQVLKQSLSDTLSLFYPLAGRVRDQWSIDCNDEGVLFKVAKIRGDSLTGFLKKPGHLVSFRAHIPLELNFEEPSPGSYVFAAQLNYFECGGLALSFVFLHNVMDGVTLSKFMKCWTAVARDSAETIEIPDYTSPSLFPQNESMRKESHLFSSLLWHVKSSKTVVRRYVFDSKAISELRAKLTTTASSPDDHHHHQLGRDVDVVQFRPSRVESVSALIWKCFMQAAMTGQTSSTVSFMTHNVDMRRRVKPALPEQSFGNFLWLVPASCSYNETHHDVDMIHLARKLREAISRVDDDFVKRMQGADGFSGYERNLEETLDEFPKKNADFMNFSSWCNFGFYRLDFGWGTPVWMTRCDAANDVESPYLNSCWLTDTRQGDGIEVWVNLEERYASAFNSVEELQALASIDPSPLDSL